MRQMRFAVLVVSCLASLVACGPTRASRDGSTGRDGGSCAISCGTPPAGCQYVQTAPLCACVLACSEGSVPNVDAGAIDASFDGEVSVVDGCTPPSSCPAPGGGCRYINATACSCGDVECFDAGPVDSGLGPIDAASSGAEAGTGLSCAEPDECLGAEFCEYGVRCLGPGRCRARPTSCNSSSPVCGCDGELYESECEANRMGIDALGAPPCTAGATMCSSNADCGPRRYCARGASCDAIGTCTDVPAQCNSVATWGSAAMCGCNGLRYSNICAAINAGQSVGPAATSASCPHF